MSGLAINLAVVHTKALVLTDMVVKEIYVKYQFDSSIALFLRACIDSSLALQENVKLVLLDLLGYLEPLELLSDLLEGSERRCELSRGCIGLLLEPGTRLFLGRNYKVDIVILDSRVGPLKETGSCRTLLSEHGDHFC